MIEKRKHARFLPEQDTFAALGQEYSKVGKVIDMSRGGLAFEYIVGEEKKLKQTKLDIFLIGDIFQLYNIPCKIVYDISIHVSHVNNSFIEALTTKRCGLSFYKLSKDDSLYLQLLLQNNFQRASFQTNI